MKKEYCYSWVESIPPIFMIILLVGMIVYGISRDRHGYTETKYVYDVVLYNDQGEIISSTTENLRPHVKKTGLVKFYDGRGVMCSSYSITGRETKIYHKPKK